MRKKKISYIVSRQSATTELSRRRGMHRQNTGAKLVHAYVLAGGGSTRFGRDKALVEIDGTPMLLRMRALLGEVAKQVNVIAAPGKCAAFGITGIGDRWDGQGPLAGIVTALLNTRETDAECQWNLIIGCDMPFLTREWLTHLIE